MSLSDEALDWLATLEGAPSVVDCPCGDWLLRRAMDLYGRGELEAAVLPSVLRALRVHAPAALDRAGLTEHATTLRALPDDVDLTHAARVAVQAEMRAWAAARVARTEARRPWLVAERAAACAVRAAREAADIIACVVSASNAASAAAEAAGWASASEDVSVSSRRSARAADHGVYVVSAANAVAAAGRAEVSVLSRRSARAAEHARCADEVRAALPDLGERVRLDRLARSGFIGGTT